MRDCPLPRKCFLRFFCREPFDPCEGYGQRSMESPLKALSLSKQQEPLQVKDLANKQDVRHHNRFR